MKIKPRIQSIWSLESNYKIYQLKILVF